MITARTQQLLNYQDKLFTFILKTYVTMMNSYVDIQILPSFHPAKWGKGILHPRHIQQYMP